MSRCPLLLLLATLLTGCPNGPEVTPPQPGPGGGGPPPVVAPTDGPVALTVALTEGQTIERTQVNAMTLTFTRSGLTGLTGARLEQRKEETAVERVLRVTATGAPWTILRDVTSSVEVLTATDAAGRKNGPKRRETELHGRQLTLQGRPGEPLEKAADATGDLRPEVAGKLVFDQLTLSGLLPPEPQLVGGQWSPTVDALIPLLGRREPARRFDGRITATLTRVLSEGTGRVAEVALTVDVTLVDRLTLPGPIEGRMRTRLVLRGTLRHDLDRRLVRRVALQGEVSREYAPVRVDFIPPGTERFSKPFAATGTLSLSLVLTPR